ncbi:MAG: SDR family oxidoreductase [Elusimicrobiota bacterium]
MKTILQKIDLTGKKVLIAGGAGHLGKMMAHSLVELGANVMLVDLVKKDLVLVQKELDKIRFGASRFLVCDISNEKDLRKNMKLAIKELSGLDILIHSAAFVGTTKFPGWAVPFESQSVKALDASLKVNMTSAFILAQEAQKALLKSSSASIIFISSIYGMVGPDMSLYEGTKMANPAGYNASKGGVLQLTRYLSTVLAPSIRVNAISPGGIWRNQPKSFVKKYSERTPLKRMATEDDIVGAVIFLASGLSSYVTGQNIVVDGGWTAW